MESLRHFYSIIKNTNLLGTFYIFIFLSFISTFLEILSIGSILPLLKVIVDENFFDKYPYFQNLVNLLSPLQFFKISSSIHTNSIAGLSVFILLVFFIRFIFQVFIEYKKADFIHNLEFLLSNKLYNNLMNSNFIFHLNENSSNFHRDIQNDIGYFSATANAITSLIIESLILIGLLILIITTQFSSTLSALLFMGIFGLLFLKITNNFNIKLGNNVHIASKERFKSLIEGFAGIKDIIVFNKVSLFIKSFEKANKKLINAKKYHTIVSSLPRILIEILLICTFVAIIFVFLSNNLSIEQSLPTLGFFAAASFRLAPSIYRILNSIQRIKFTKKPIENLYSQLRNLSKKERSSKNDLSNISFKNDLQINNLSFYYSDNKNILDKLNLRIKKGDAIGIYGESGSGKSTLINILAGLIKPQQGEILSDSKNIFLNISSWREKIGYVPQSIFLMDDTLLKNITFGSNEEEVDIKKFKKCILDAELEKFVEELNNKEQTHLGEAGSKISGGQLQRIGIARALYNDPEILIFDESTSSLDLETEREIIKNIYKFKNLKTLIIISHKVDLLKGCNKIYKLENRKISKKND